jgi:hypothetical protein
MTKAFFLLAAVALACAGCASMEVPSLGGAVAQNVGTAVVDFHSDEVLASTGDDSMFQSFYMLAKIMTPASNATKNQAQVLFVNDGSKQWVKWTMTSRKAETADFVVGAVLLYPTGWSGYDKITASEYRSNQWKLGRVTSTDDMFKNIVEIAGEPYAIKLIRVPLVKVEE